MTPLGIPIRCLCGRSFEIAQEALASGASCPGCGRPIPSSAPTGPVPEPSLEKILLDRGWVSPQQIRAAQEKVQGEERQGRRLRLGQALLQSGAITPEQLREALALQGKTPMRCPSCGKLYNVKGYSPGSRALCRACGTELGIPGPLGSTGPVEEGPVVAVRRPAAADIDPVLTDLVPGYRLERRLGSGEMGEVFLARRKGTEQPVAIRLLPPDLGRQPEYVQRFLSEGRSATRIAHENLATVLEAGEAAGRCYLVSEYIEGEPLKAVLQREGPLPEARALDIARQIALGLRQASQGGVFHRGLRPSSIMIRPDRRVKVCDLGLARETGPGVALQTGKVLSPPLYSSPEQCRGEANLDHRSDMYSLGAILFEMLVGRPPFQAESPGDLAAKHVLENPPSPRTLRPEISPAADQLVLTLLSKRPDARFATYDELLAALEALPAPRPAAAPSRRIDILRTRRRASFVKWILAGVAAILILWVLNVLLSRLSVESPPAPAAKTPASPVETALREMRRLEEESRGNPNQYPMILERWRELERQYRNTPHHALFAGPRIQFEERMASEATSSAEAHFLEANQLVEAGRYPEALQCLRNYPAGFAGTEASRRVIARIKEIDTRMQERYQAGKEAVYTYIGQEKFREAQRQLEALRSLVSFTDPEGNLQYARPEYADELHALSKKIEEEYLLARRRREEARSKETPPEPPPSETTKPTPETPPPPSPPPPTPVPPPAPAKLPEPDVPSQRKVLAEIQDLFREEYARKTPSDRLALARKLIETAGQTKDDPVARYVLYREAQDLAMMAGDFELALKTVDEVGRHYAVNVASTKTALLASAARNARTPEEIKGLAGLYLRQGEEALAADDLDSADRLVQQALGLARRAKDAALQGRAESRAREIQEMKPRFERARKARETLAANPEDPASHLALGQYLCLCKGDWTSGLLHLVRGGDPNYRNAASKDMENPSEASPQVAVGDAWYELGERETGMARQALRQRASLWYERAVLNLSGLTRLRVEKRINDIRLGK